MPFKIAFMVFSFWIYFQGMDARTVHKSKQTEDPGFSLFRSLHHPDAKLLRKEAINRLAVRKRQWHNGRQGREILMKLLSKLKVVADDPNSQWYNGRTGRETGQQNIVKRRVDRIEAILMTIALQCPDILNEFRIKKRDELYSNY